MMGNQRGVASIVGVTLTAFLILILTVAIAGSSNGELQHATDTVDNIKAYFNAQSGTEEAILAVKDGNANYTNLSQIDQGCGSDTLGGTGLYGPAIPGLSCRQIATSSQEAVDVLANNQVVQYDLTNTTSQANYNIDRVTLQWDMEFPTGSDKFDDSHISPATALRTQEDSWPSNAPPVIELTVSNYFPGQPSNVDQCSLLTNCPAVGSSGTAFLLPQWYTSCKTEICPPFYDFKNAYGGSPVVPVICQPPAGGGSYRCKANLIDIAPPGYKTVLRLQARYGDASYDLQAYDASGAQAQMPLQSAQIDVTDSVANAFSRVQLEVPVRSSVYPGFEALYGDSSLCKSFDLVTSGTGPNPTYTAVNNASGGNCPFQ